MIKHWRLLLCMHMITPLLFASCDSSTDITIFNAQNLSQSLSLETALQSFKVSYKGQGPGGGAKNKTWLYTDWSIFYFQSFNGTNQAKAFFPDDQASIIIGQNNDSDVSSSWIGVLSSPSDPFESIVSINPFRQVWGGTFKALVDFGALFPDLESALKNMWTSIYVPVTHVKHNLNLTEQLLGGVGLTPGFQTAIQALNSPEYQFGILAVNVLTATAPDDMQWRLGWNFHRAKNTFASLSFVLFIPLGKRNTARYLFEPTVGNGGHWGPGLSLVGSYAFWNTPRVRASLTAEMRWNYLMNGTERRTFDLTNGDWSRFLLVASINNTLDPIPGVNFLTRDASVTPRNTLDFLLSLNYNREPFTMEVGYDLWWKQRERVTLPANSQPLAFAIPAFTQSLVPGQSLQAVIYSLTGCCPKTSFSQAQICQGVPQPNGLPTDATPIAITNSDLNLSSATKPSTVYMKIYAGCMYSAKEMPAAVGFCGSVEVNGPVNALRQWGVWARASYSF